MKKLFILAMLSLLPLYAHAEQNKDMAQELAETPMDPVVEKRLVDLSQNLRCLVCQNESLASSHAELAADLRREVREMIVKGMSDKEITDYLVHRYGDFVLYDPPVKSYTMLLWFGPFVMFLLGGGMLFYQLRKRRNIIPEAELSPEAERKAEALLKEDQ